jgi:hypothetical protein
MTSIQNALLEELVEEEPAVDESEISGEVI